MAVSKYFQSGNGPEHKPTQDVVERMIIQSIKVAGHDIVYIPRTHVNISEVFVEDPLAKFESAFLIEMYLQNAQGFGGDGSFLSKFGIEVNSTAEFVVSQSRWIEEIGRKPQSRLPNRPTEGDLIYFVRSQTLFEIKKVDSQNPFYQLGKLYVWTLSVETFQPSSELLATGIQEIDHNPYLFSLDEESYPITMEDGSAIAQEQAGTITQESYSVDNLDKGSQNDTFDAGIDGLLDFSESNPFGEIRNK